MAIPSTLKKAPGPALVILLLLPLFFINIKSSHDWGDDFAQYIHQAKNITGGQSQNETGYIFNENCFTGPQAYPAGFPLLLSPVIKAWGIDYRALNLYMSLFLALTCLVGFLLLRRYTGFVTALATTLIIAYNPTLLNFKTEVISDLPFTFFSMLCAYLILQQEGLAKSVLLGLLMGFTIHIRSVGAVLVIVFVFHKLFIENSIRSFSVKKHLNTGVTLACCALVYLAIRLALPCNSNYPFFEWEHYWGMLNDHLSYNMHHLSWMFRSYGTQDYWSIGILASCCLIAFGFLGFLHFARENRRSFICFYVPAYLFMVFSYKFSHAGMRFLFPVLFFIFLFAIYGLKKSLEPFVKKNQLFAGIVGILVLFSYKDEVMRFIEHRHDLTDGPQIPEAQAAFAYINTNVAANAVIAFDKPRVLTLYTGSRSFAFNPSISPEGILDDIQKFRVEYILTSETQSTENIKNFPKSDTALCRLVYANAQLSLYKISR